jgi:hypothetical protein
MAPGVNRIAEMPSWALGKLKRSLEALMLAQCGGKRAPSPLPGRPAAHVIRFSSVESDMDNSHSKFVIDRLCVGKLKRPKKMPEAMWAKVKPRLTPPGLHYLRDDKPSALRLECWWEPAPPGKGFVYIALFEAESP